MCGTPRIGALSLAMLALASFAACGPSANSPPPVSTPPTNPPALLPAELEAATLATEAGFIFNFTRFTTWPSNIWESATSPVVIGVLGSGELVDVLERSLAGKRLGVRSYAVRRCATVADCRTCTVVYVASSESNRLTEVIENLAGTPALTVSKVPGFVDAGGMVEIMRTNQSVVFQVNLAAINSAGLEMSSKVLRLARRIVVEPR